MSLNLNKYGLEMQAAWKEVMDESSETDWALFGYVPNTFDLKLVSKGDRGIDEVVQELNASAIMYAFVGVDCPETDKREFVFIHWQGETCPAARKGRAATHLRDVERYFPGHHLTVTARCEEDIDAEDIAEQVAQVSKAKFDFKDKCATAAEVGVGDSGAVGSTHKRIIPQQELPKMSERERFWLEEESKEKARIETERQRKISEAKKLDSDRRKREEEEAKAREALIKDRERKISQLKGSGDQGEKEKKREEQEKWAAQQQEDVQDELARQNRGEEMKRKRSEEARQLIGRQRSQEARAVFEQHTAYGQMNRKQSSNSRINEEAASPPPPPQNQLRSNGESKISNNQNNASAVRSAVSPAGAVASSPSPPPPQPAAAAAAPLPPAPAGSVPVTSSAPPQQVVAANDVANANEICTDDIVVPPPELFGNNDNHRSPANQQHIQQQQQQLLQQQQKQQQPQAASPPVEQQAAAAAAPIPAVAAAPPDVTSNNSSTQPDLIQDVTKDKKSAPDLTKTGAGVGGSGQEYGICAVALYDYQAADETEISFDPGQVITHIDKIDPGWWQGLSPSGNCGLFPSNYVELVDPKDLVVEN